MEEVFAELRSRFDRVIIDAPPLLPVSDAVVLGGISDGVIVVARYRHVRREQFVMAVDNLRSANATVLGTILTQVPGKLHQARYGDDYDYAHPTPQPLDTSGADAEHRGPEPRAADRAPRGATRDTSNRTTGSAMVHPPTKPVTGNNRPPRRPARRPGQTSPGRSQGAGRPRT